jgi:hypothetical protein
MRFGYVKKVRAKDNTHNDWVESLKAKTTEEMKRYQ